MHRRSKTKLIPKKYLYAQLSLIAYGAFANTIVFISQTPSTIRTISNLNTAITFIWATMNLFLFFFFNIKRYETEARVFSGYNFLINSFNLSNIFFQYITNYKLLFYMSVTVKILELSACVILLRRKKMWNKN